jgi:hypothetical protein
MILRLVIIQYERSSLKPDLDVELLAVLVLVYEEPALGDHSVLLLPRGEKAALDLKLEPAPHCL